MKGKTVVVTGTSRGIGKGCVIKLAEYGFHVLATVRDEKSAETWRQSRFKQVEPVVLDITCLDSVKAFQKALVDQNIYGLVNNAGMAVLGPIEFIPLDEIRKQFEVNLFGHIAIIQALLPNLRAAQGRIINMSSISGFVGFPFFGPYCSSKFALEGFSESLRRELKDQGIAVSLIEPGNVDTGIWEQSFDDSKVIEDKFPSVAYELYGRRFTARSGKDYGPSVKDDPMVVASVVLEALTASYPKERYLVGRYARKLSLLKRVFGNNRFNRWFVR